MGSSISWEKPVVHNFTSVIVDRKMEGGPVAVVQHHKSKEESLTQRWKWNFAFSEQH